MSAYADQIGQVPLKQLRTSKLAVAGGLLALLCPTGVGGLLGLVLGILGLAQIRAGKGEVGGAAMAWIGVVLGLAQVIVVGLVYNYVSGQTRQAPQAVETFMAGLCRKDMEAAAQAMTAGLKPTLDRGRAEAVADGLVEALGEYQGIGAVRRVEASWQKSAMVVEAEIDLKFAKGAPAQGVFTLASEYDRLRVRSFLVRSPVLRDPIEVRGAESQELGQFGSGSGKGGPKLKSFCD